MNGHRSHASREKHSPLIEACGSRQFLSPYVRHSRYGLCMYLRGLQYALGRYELDRRSFPRYVELGTGVDRPAYHSPDMLLIDRDTGFSSDQPRTRVSNIHDRTATPCLTNSNRRCPNRRERQAARPNPQPLPDQSLNRRPLSLRGCPLRFAACSRARLVIDRP